MKKIILILTIFCYTIKVNSQTYRQLFDNLNVSFQTQPHSFFSQLEGSRVETNAMIMSAYLNMYEATHDIKYLNQFVIDSKRAIDRRDDFILTAQPVSGLPIHFIRGDCDEWINNTNGIVSRPAWSKLECNDNVVEYYPHWKESGNITYPMARFVLLIKQNPNLSTLMLPNEVNGASNASNFGNTTVTDMGQYADWLKARVYETLNFHYFNDWDDWAGRFVTDYSNGKGYNLQCAIGRTLIIMNYIANMENDIATVAGYTNVIEKIAAYLYDNIHSNIPTTPATVGNGLLWYTWVHYEGDILIEDISHAMLDEEFAELYMEYFHPVSGYGRFDITDMKKFANGFAHRIVSNPLELKMNTYGTNCNCDQMCCVCDNYDQDHEGSGCNGVGQNPSPVDLSYQSLAYIFLTKYNDDIYQEISDFYMPGNNYENVANVQALYAYSMLAKYENVFNPIAVNRSTYADSQWAGCAGSDFDGDGIEEFVTVRNKDGALEIFELNSNNNIVVKASIVNHPNNWAGVAAGKIAGINGEVIFAVNNSDNSIYAYQFNGASVGQIGGITTSFNGYTGIAVGDVIIANPESEIAVLKENGLVSFYKFVNGQFTLIINEQTNIASAVGISIGDFDADNPGAEISIINNTNGHLNIYKLENTNGYSLVLINTFTATNGTYNNWNGLTTGDFDNDGIDEIIAHRNFDGDFFVFKITNGQLLNNYKESFPVNTQHGVMGTIKYKGKDALLALRNYDGNMFAFTLDGYCQGLDISSDINENNSIDNSSASISNEYTIDYHSNNTITVGDMTIAPSAGSNENVDAVFVSGKEIIFKPGFEVKAGATMHAYIDPVNFGCDNNFNLKSFSTNPQTNTQTYVNSHKITPTIGDKKQTVKTTSLSTLNNSTQFKMSLAPNPNQGLFEVKLQGNSDNGKIVIYDCLSRPLKEYDVRGNDQLIDLTEQSNGIYIVKYSDNKVTETGRILKH